MLKVTFFIMFFIGWIQLHPSLRKKLIRPFKTNINCQYIFVCVYEFLILSLIFKKDCIGIFHLHEWLNLQSSASVWIIDATLSRPQTPQPQTFIGMTLEAQVWLLINTIFYTWSYTIQVIMVRWYDGFAIHVIHTFIGDKILCW